MAATARGDHQLRRVKEREEAEARHQAALEEAAEKKRRERQAEVSRRLVAGGTTISTDYQEVLWR